MAARPGAAVGGLLVVLLALSILSLRHMSLTIDEPDHYRYGLQLLHLDATRFADSAMPFTALNALPGRLAEALPEGALRSLLGHPIVGRPATVLGSVVLALYVCAWCRRLYGTTAALLALMLYVLDPNLIAHAGLVTTDLYAALMTTAALYHFWRFAKLGGWGRATVSAVVLGLSQLAKYTCVSLYPIFLLLAAVQHARGLGATLAAGDGAGLARQLARFGGYTALFVTVSLVVVNAGFFVDRSLTPLGDYRFRSREFQVIQSSLSWCAGCRVPVPYPFLEGLDWVVFQKETPGGHGLVYLLGERRAGRGFRTYYVYAFLYKVPIATQLILWGALGAYLWRRRFGGFLGDELFLLLPAAFFFVYFNLFFEVQQGIHHLLVIFPLLYVFSGSLLRAPVALGRRGRTILAVLLAYLVVSVLSYFPHYLPYFNELVPDRKQAYRILADSNIDWGQSAWDLQRFVRAHPEAVVEPAEPTAGTIVVGVNALTGVLNPRRYRWLRDHFEPVDHIAYSYLVYRVSAEDLARIRPGGTDEPAPSGGRPAP